MRVVRRERQSTAVMALKAIAAYKQLCEWILRKALGRRVAGPADPAKTFKLRKFKDCSTVA